ncbi:hypothetical protein SALBM311S_07575 [Streptomyces alboniger]
MPYMIWSGPEGLPSPGLMWRVTKFMNASASPVKPSRSSAYTQNAASRTHTYR